LRATPAKTLNRLVRQSLALGQANEQVMGEGLFDLVYTYCWFSYLEYAWESVATERNSHGHDTGSRAFL
jgi:hypothetical protein